MGIFDRLKKVVTSQLSPEFAARLGTSPAEKPTPVAPVTPAAPPTPAPALRGLARAETKYSPFWPPRGAPTPIAPGEVPPSPAAAAAVAGLPERKEIIPGLPPTEAPPLAPTPPAYPAARPRAIERFVPAPAEAVGAASRGDIESLSVDIAALRDQNRLILDRLARIEELLRARGV